MSEKEKMNQDGTEEKTKPAKADKAEKDCNFPFAQLPGQYPGSCARRKHRYTKKYQHGRKPCLKISSRPIKKVHRIDQFQIDSYSRIYFSAETSQE